MDPRSSQGFFHQGGRENINSRHYKQRSCPSGKNRWGRPKVSVRWGVIEQILCVLYVLLFYSIRTLKKTPLTKKDKKPISKL